MDTGIKTCRGLIFQIFFVDEFDFRRFFLWDRENQLLRKVDDAQTPMVSELRSRICFFV